VVRSVALSAVLLLTSACARERAPAPEDVDGLSRFIFTHWEDEDLVAEGMTNLAIWLDGEGRGPIASEDGYRLTPLTAEDIGPLQFPDRVPLDSLIGVAVAAESPFSIDEHAAILPLEDQAYTAPKKYERYARSLSAGSAGAFLAGGAHTVPEVIRTDNDIVQERIGVRVPYTLNKDYRWVVTEDGQRAVIGRTWAPEIGCSGDDGESGNCLELSFSVDLYLEDTDGDTMRFTSTWNQMSLIVDFGEDFQVAQMANGMLAVFVDTDTFLVERNTDGD
jgi:hypothetical protein